MQNVPQLVYVDPPLLQLYVYVGVPPDVATAAVPFDVPAHDKGVLDIDTDNAITGSVTVILPFAVHKLTSDTVTAYTPDTSPVAIIVFCASFHVYAYGVVPDVAVAVAVPSLPAKQFTFVPLNDTLGPPGLVTACVAVTIHPLPSVIVIS